MRIYTLFIALLLVSLTLQAQRLSSLRLEKGFRNPPDQAKARTWWHWISGNVSKSGITKDLEAMKRVGIQEAQLFNVHLGFPQGPVKYLSEEWLELFKYSAEEAQRLGLELAFHNSAGWSSSGGPWVTEEYAMQTLVFSEKVVKGGISYKNTLPEPETKFGYYRDIAVVAFPKPKTEKKIDGLDYKILSERIRNHLLPDSKTISSEAIIEKETIIDLTENFSKEGILSWEVPDGEWIILRMGHTPMGTRNRPAPAGGQGFEVDKMSKKALDVYWDGGVQPIIDKLGSLIGTTVNNCLIDSYEVETTNWTPGFDAQFKELRGYDLLAFVPALAGYYVESGEVSERFLWDFRRTIGDLIATNYYGHFAELCHKNNLKFSVEPYWGPFDNMQVGATGDIVMCEFWSGGYPFFDSAKFVSSIAHLNGSAIVGAESFTGIGGWDDHPAQFKTIGDRAWAEGITRFIFHTYVHQPWDVAPGLALSYHGTDFNRLNTWWNQSEAYMKYIARSQYLLQQGRNVADVLVFTGESSPNTAFLKPNIKALGYDYDLIGANKLQELLVKDGFIVTPSGGRYNVLMLTDFEWAKPETLEKIQQLVTEGASVIGAKPRKSPSLEDYPHCDMMVNNLAEKLWGKGLVLDLSIEEFLEQRYPVPDFEVNADKDIHFIHRKTDKADIYFIANTSANSKESIAQFRVSGKQPKIWNAETGKIDKPAFFRSNKEGTTSLPLHLDAEEAVFVIFKNDLGNRIHLTEAKVSYTNPPSEPLTNLKIRKAEYGTFLQEGLIDLTDKVAGAVKDNQLDFTISRAFCDCDPAMGYKKEFRMEYRLGATTHQLYAEEREHIFIDAQGEDLKILKAVFGKFKQETTGVPAVHPVYDVTSKIDSLVAEGVLHIPVTEALIDGQTITGDHPALKIKFFSGYEEQSRLIEQGQVLRLSKENLTSRLFYKNDSIVCSTPRSGTLNYTTNMGQTNTANFSVVPQPLDIITDWEISFPLKNQSQSRVALDSLVSWSNFEESNIKYYSGTAIYTKTFDLPKSYVAANKALVLDLGAVAVVADVVVNGKELGTLWKAPFQINIENYVHKGINTLELRVTNLWPNRLIGDEHLALDYERKGDRLSRLPQWLAAPDERTSSRSTFTSWKHWNADDELLPSGLLGPVTINVISKMQIKI